MKFFLTILGILALLAPTYTAAQVDQRCWTQSACTKARTELLSELTAEQALDGFIPAIDNSQVRDACRAEKNAKGELLGFCLPAGKTRTNISFGGKKEFEGIGDFIEFGYRYAFAIATLLAVVMFIVGGVQWSISGGGEGKSAAQKRITNAIIGLVLLALSYALLSFVNPNLVSLRLPQTWLINPIQLAPVYCADVEKKQVALLGPSRQRRSPQQIQDAYRKGAFNITYDITQRKLTSESQVPKCGFDYLVEDAGGQSCRGTMCPENMVCARKNAQEAGAEFSRDAGECIQGDVVIYVEHSLKSIVEMIPFAEKWVYPWIDRGETELHVICQNGDTFEIESSDRTINNDAKETQQSILTFASNHPLTEIVTQKCGADQFKGLFLIVELNENLDPSDEDHYVGKGGVDLGDSGAFEITKDYIINKNLAEQYFFSIADIEKGVPIDIDAANFTDIDLGSALEDKNIEEKRQAAYGNLGYK